MCGVPHFHPNPAAASFIPRMTAPPRRRRARVGERLETQTSARAREVKGAKYREGGIKAPPPCVVLCPPSAGPYSFSPGALKRGTLLARERVQTFAVSYTRTQAGVKPHAYCAAYNVQHDHSKQHAKVSAQWSPAEGVEDGDGAIEISGRRRAGRGRGRHRCQPAPCPPVPHWRRVCAAIAVHDAAHHRP